MSLHGLSDRFLAAVAGDHKAVFEIEVHTAAGTLLEDITDAVTGGSVGVDETRKIRRTCQLQITPTPDLVPASLSDLLHPASGNELWISRGVQYPDGSTEFAKLGTFRMTKPALADTKGQLSFAVNGQDRSSVVSRRGWLTPYQVPAATNAGGIIEAALQTRLANTYPDIVFNITTDTFSFPATTWGANPGSPSDPMSDFITFAANAGCETFFDPDGNPLYRPIVNPLTATVIDATSFVEGENATFEMAGRTLDESTAYNGVVLNCNGTGDAGPFQVSVWDIDPASPTYYLGVWGQVPYPMTTTAIPAGQDSLGVAQGKALNMAVQQLQLILGSFDDVNLTTVPNPALREGDCVRVVRRSLKIDADYVISNMNIPLDVTSAMAIGFRPRVQAA